MFRHANSISAQTRARRHKRSKASAVAAVAVIGVFFCSPVAVGHDDEVLDPMFFELLDKLEKEEADYERKRSDVCEKLDRLIADQLGRRFDNERITILDDTLELIEAWEGYCKGREFDEALIKKSLEYFLEDKNADD